MAPRKTKAKVGPSEAKPWVNRIVGHSVVPAKSLTANPLNFRHHPDVQVEAMSDTLDRVVWIQQVVVNKTTGRMIDGHLRVQLAAKRGESVPVTYVELTEAEERLALASFDPLSSLAIDDPERLSTLIAGLELPEGALGLFLSSNAEEVAHFSLGEVGAEPEGSRSLGQSVPRLAIVIAMEDVSLVEKAILSTGHSNRAKAILDICEAYLHAQGQFDILAKA